MKIQLLMAIGTQGLPYLTASRIRLTNIVSLYAFAISSLYAVTDVVPFMNLKLATVNFLFSISYLITLLCNHHHNSTFGKIWLFCVLMLQLFMTTNWYMDNQSGFHMYYYLIPVGSFLLFNSTERVAKYSISIIAILLNIYCHNTPNPNPILVLSDQVNQVLFQSVILISMLVLIVIMMTFNRYIETNENLLKRQAFTDPLTGIANRTAFFEKGEQLLEFARACKTPFSLIIVDIDHFKVVNDNYGHLAGDLCLTEVCNIIQKQCRAEDLFARIGGEEFAIILPNTSLESAQRIAERARVAVESHSIELNNSLKLKCTASFGISSKNNGDTLKKLIKQADSALYKAKALGRNCIQSYLSSIH